MTARSALDPSHLPVCYTREYGGKNDPPVFPTMAILYHRILGDAFDGLPASLRVFHSQPGGGLARGILRVERGKGWLHNALATLMRLPRQGSEVPVRLRVVPQEGKERWVRDFAGHRLETIQWAHQGLLMEAAGPLRLGYRVAATSDGYRIELVRCDFLTLPLPAALAPRIWGTVSARPQGWHLSVRIETPARGLLAMYEGELVLE